MASFVTSTPGATSPTSTNLIASAAESNTLTSARVNSLDTDAFELLHGCRVVYRNKEDFSSKLNKMRLAGLSKLNVVTDFDFTLTSFHTATGDRGASCHKIIEDCGLLSHDSYHPQAQALQQKYYPLEVDPSLDMEAKIGFMVEWVTQAHALLQNNGLTQPMIATAVRDALANGKVELREGVDRFFAALAREKVPSLIFSAGLADVLEQVLQQRIPQLNWTLLNVISNRCIFDGEGDAISGFTDPMIHVFNKRSSSFLHTDFFRRDDTLQRSSLLLLGDSLGDLAMADGMSYDADAALKVAFLNDRTERLSQYLGQGDSAGFDLVILNDPDFEVPNGLIEFITNNISSSICSSNGESNS